MKQPNDICLVLYFDIVHQLGLKKCINKLC